jgi:hypothetical protein
VRALAGDLAAGLSAELGDRRGPHVGAALRDRLGLIAKRLIGGHTGDVLGGIEQVFEVGFLLGVAAILT